MIWWRGTGEGRGHSGGVEPPAMQGYLASLLGIQGHLAHEKHPSRTTLQWPYAQGPMVILEGWVFFERGTPVTIWWRGTGEGRGHSGGVEPRSAGGVTYPKL